MSKLTTQEWKGLQSQIGLFSSVYLLIDGIPFEFREARYKNKIIVQFYICNVYQGYWLNEYHPFWKYHYQSTHKLYSKKEERKMYSFWKKVYDKKEADKRLEDAKITFRRIFFPSLTAFKRTINKVADSVKIISPEEYNTLSVEYRANNPELFVKKEEPAQ